MNPFIALLTSLPTGNSTIRMRVWRALKSTGCGVLRDGVYVLPVSAPQAPALAEVESAVRAAGGFAMTAELSFNTPAQFEYVRRLFDRGEEYGALVARIGAAKLALRRLGQRKADTLVQRLRRSFDELVALDFYPGQAHLQAKEALAGLELESQRSHAEGEPHAARGKVRRLDPAKYRNRNWATRKHPWVDRLASAWLIKRFIDRSARFVWIDKPRDKPRGALGFDFDGADFTHVGNRVTFEVLLSSFDLDGDPALHQLAAIVHFLDVGGIPVEDARGLELVLKGARDSARGDDELVVEAAKVFDHAYAAYRNKRDTPSSSGT
ncbi:MAG TPA: chromate resistance protein ChrB domain-containing protein [Burkholderiales bacterium]|nr:chromate resistance protein ChrB domain-containing protein [Burkholderiales bacterium]